MWNLSPSELHAAFAGAGSQRAWWYELALYTAWHVAALTAQANAGHLKPWTEYRQRVGGGDTAPPTPAPTSWQARKAERQRQMQLHQRHMQQRRSLPTPKKRRPHG